MKQLSLALHNYHTAQNTFPPDTIWAQRPLVKALTVPLAAGEQRNYTWIALILPFIEEGPLYDQIDFRLPIWGQRTNQGEEIRSQRISVLECPSDTPYRDTDFTHGFAWTSYAGNEGYDWWARRGDGYYNGVFPFDGCMAIRDIADGTSNTIAIGEVGTRSVTDCKALGWAANREGGSGCWRQNATDGVFRVSLVGTQIEPGVSQDMRTRYGGMGLLHPDGTPITNWWNSNTWNAPYAYSPRYMSHRAINSAHWSSAASMHPGGAMFGIADGSVKFIPETVETGNWDAEGQFGNMWMSLNSIGGPIDAAPVVWD